MRSTPSWRSPFLSMSCFSFLSIYCSLYWEYTFPVISVNLHILRRAPQISPLPLNHSMSPVSTCFPASTSTPEIYSRSHHLFLLHPQCSCPNGILVQLLESLPPLLSPAIWPLPAVLTASLLKASTCDVLAVGCTLSHCSHAPRWREWHWRRWRKGEKARLPVGVGRRSGSRDLSRLPQEGVKFCNLFRLRG